MVRICAAPGEVSIRSDTSSNKEHRHLLFRRSTPTKGSSSRRRIRRGHFAERNSTPPPSVHFSVIDMGDVTRFFDSSRPSFSVSADIAVEKEY
jgi:hypothetical protein